MCSEPVFNLHYLICQAVLWQRVFLPSVHCGVWPALGAVWGQILSLPRDAPCRCASWLHPLQLPLRPRSRGLVHRGDIVTERGAQRSVSLSKISHFCSWSLLKTQEDYYRAKLFNLLGWIGLKLLGWITDFGGPSCKLASSFECGNFPLLNGNGAHNLKKTPLNNMWYQMIIDFVLETKHKKLEKDHNLKVTEPGATSTTLYLLW